MAFRAAVTWGLAMLGLLTVAPEAQAREMAPMAVSWWTGSVSLALGEKTVPSLNADHRKQDLVGLRVTFGRNRWPVTVALDMELSEGDTDAAGESVEISEWRFGVRKTYGRGVLHPFWGGGLAVTRLKVDAPSGVGRYGPDPGYWVSAGANVDITRGSHLGISWVYTGMNIESSAGTVDGARGVRVYWGKRW